MTIQDIVNMEKENKDSIVLLKEGIFWKAYEMSAYLFHTYIKPFKLLRKYVETIKGDVVSLGFPVAGTEKQLQGLNVLLHEDDKIILSVSQTEHFTEDDFWNFKAKIPLMITKTENKETIKKQSVSVHWLEEKIKSFNIESKTPLDCMMFLTKIKEELNQ